MNLGITIHKLRKHRGLRQGDLAIRSGLTQAYLSQIEKNRKEPNISALKRICEVLAVPMPILFFLSLDNEDIPTKKQEAFNVLSPSIKSFIEEFFIGPARLTGDTV